MAESVAAIPSWSGDASAPDAEAAARRAPAVNAPSPADAMRGILLMLAGVFCYSVMSTLIRQLGAAYPVSQIVLFRCLAATPAVGFLVWRAGGLSVLRPARWEFHLLRAIVGLGAMALTFKAFAMMPLADAIALMFVAPLFLTALSALLLRERVGPRRWAATLCGFIGVLLIVHPGSGALTQGGAAYAISGAFLMALSLILVRRMGRSDHPAATTFWFTVAGVAATGAVSLVVGLTRPTALDLLLLVSVGVSGGLAQYLMTTAFRLAEVAVIAPLEYTRLLWGAAFTWVLWGEYPSIWVWSGAAIVIGANLYTVLRERRLGLLAASEGRRLRD